MTNNDMTPANAIIAPVSLLLTLDATTADAIITLIRHFDFQLTPEDRDSINRALDNPNFSPGQIARVRHELYRRMR